MVPGIYRMNFRGLTLREAWRFSGEPFKFVIALALKAAGFGGSRLWLPPHECVAPCTAEDLSPEAAAALLPAVAEARDLGYTEGRYSRLVRLVDPSNGPGFAHLALHRDRQRFIFLAFATTHAGGISRSASTISGGLLGDDGIKHSFLNHNNYFDDGQDSVHHRVRGRTVAAVDTAMQQHTAQSRCSFRGFATLADLKATIEALDEAAFDARIARGLFRYVGSELPPGGIPPPL